MASQTDSDAMASSAATTISRQEASALVRQVQGTQLINRQLSSVCQVNGLKSTGVKAELQRRIINPFECILLVPFRGLVTEEFGLEASTSPRCRLRFTRLPLARSRQLCRHHPSPVPPRRLPSSRASMKFAKRCRRAKAKAPHSRYANLRPIGSIVIQEAVNAGDVSRFHQIRQSVVNAFSQRPSPAKAASSRNSYHQSSSQTAMPRQPSNGMPSYPPNSLGAYRVAVANGQRPDPSYKPMPPMLSFKPSPFYHVEKSVSDVRACEIMQHHRHSIHIPIKLKDDALLQKCVDDASYRVMVFCASDVNGVQDIAFPHQSELRVNGDEIKANLRGLKNKPGSTRPVDVTNSLRLKSNYQNNIEFIYALTHKKFYLVVNVCKVTTVKEMVSIISTRRRIPKDSVVVEINKKAQDPDVVATSQVLSLKCPLTYMRLNVPCRSLSCTHIQCFDAESYLQLQEQGPQWLCPICNKSAPFEQLAVDEYVRDILDKTSKSLETVTIEPNGRWSIRSSDDERRPTATNGAMTVKGEDDDDDIEISEVSIVGGRRFETPRNQATSVSVGTATPISRGTSSPNVGPRGAGSTSSKRPTPAVIDLTLSSDDEDDEPIERPNKRQRTGTNGHDNLSTRNFLSESPMSFPH